MRIVYHLGAHCTDEERLLRCLLKNRGVLGAQGIDVPGPTRYRNLLRDTAIALKGRPATPETEAMLLEQISESEGARRMVLSWENFLAFLPWAVDGALYPAAGPRTRAFAQVFPGCEAEFHLALRNPASFLPEVFQRQKEMKGGKPDMAAFCKDLDLDELRWSDVVWQILEANPGAPVTVWCDEDAPLIWPEILSAVSGAAPGTALQDEGGLVDELLTEEGRAHLAAGLAGIPPGDAMARRQVVVSALARHALPGRLSQEIEMEGWTPATVEALTAAYAEDLDQIASLPGVTLLRP